MRALMTADAVGGVWTYALELARAAIFAHPAPYEPFGAHHESFAVV